MSPDTLLVLAILILALLLFYILLSRKLTLSSQDPILTEWLKSIQGSLISSNQNLTTTLQRSYHDLNQRLDHATDVIGQLKQETGAFSEIGRSMQQLQQFLQSPKLRGNIGEQVLKDLIVQMFPKSSFFLQYPFKSGYVVDAAIKTEAGILPIDSKFPMENYLKMVQAGNKNEQDKYLSLLIKDVKKHVHDISAKYINPAEKTLDFALMYIPSESVYYEIVNQPALVDFARQFRVYPVSPNTLYAHLQTILLSFEGKKIESKTHEIFALLRSIKKEHEHLDASLNVLNRHLTNAFNQINTTKQSSMMLGQKLDSTKMLESSLK